VVDAFVDEVSADDAGLVAILPELEGIDLVGLEDEGLAVEVLGRGLESLDLLLVLGEFVGGVASSALPPSCYASGLLGAVRLTVGAGCGVGALGVLLAPLAGLFCGLAATFAVVP
jgi:hypothetical protein